MDVFEAMHTRSACRAFLDRPVPHHLIEKILEAARWAPSGVNSQPWFVAVARGESKSRITQALLDARARGEKESPDYQYYPGEWREPYKARRKVCGLTMYAAQKVAKDDPAAREKSWNSNYHFFGAPVALFFFVDRSMAQGAWVDMGMFLQNVMLAAQALGLATCPQASLADYPAIIRDVLGVSADRALACGMALGYADPDAAVNQYRLEREPVSAFATWHE
jgi:nitroreductase